MFDQAAPRYCGAEVGTAEIPLVAPRLHATDVIRLSLDDNEVVGEAEFIETFLVKGSLWDIISKGGAGDAVYVLLWKLP